MSEASVVLQEAVQLSQTVMSFPEPFTSKQLSQRLESKGFFISLRSMRYHLQALVQHKILAKNGDMYIYQPKIIKEE